jgi:hypothetical protein
VYGVQDCALPFCAYFIAFSARPCGDSVSQHRGDGGRRVALIRPKIDSVAISSIIVGQKGEFVSFFWLGESEEVLLCQYPLNL